MKDPLRYFLDEGFGHIFAYPLPEGRMDARMRWARGYPEFAPTFDKDGTMTMCGVSYTMDSETIAKYATFVSTPEEAVALIEFENFAWENLKKTIAAIKLEA